MDRARAEHLPGGGGRWRLLLWLLPAGLLANLLYAFLATDRDALGAGLRLDGGWLAVAGLLAVLPVACNICRVWRWGRLLAPGFPLRSAVRAVLIAEVGAALTPTAIGGAPLKAAVLARSGLGPAGGVAASALGGIEDAVVIGLAIPLAAWSTGLLPRFLEDLGDAAVSARPGGTDIGLWATVLVLSCLALILLRHRRAAPLRARAGVWGRSLREHLRLVRTRGLGTFAGNLALAGLQWSARLSILTALAAGFGVTLEPLRAAVLQWLCFTCMVLVPTPGAVGGAEAAFVLVYAREVPAALLPLTVAAWRLVTFYGVNGLSLLILVLQARRRRGSPPGAIVDFPVGDMRPADYTGAGCPPTGRGPHAPEPAGHAGRSRQAIGRSSRAALPG